MNDEYIIMINEHEKEIETNKQLFDLTMEYLISNGQDELSCALSKVFAAAELFHEDVIDRCRALLEKKNE